LSKIESGQLDLHCEYILLNELVEDLRAELYPFAIEKELI
jgi:hypothetical protein